MRPTRLEEQEAALALGGPARFRRLVKRVADAGCAAALREELEWYR